jgi:hypothetical protein
MKSSWNINGFLGTGITVGVLSDSYNTSPKPSFTPIRAANDIATGDLVTPKFVIDSPASSNNTDEGRAMMQIVHDVAPNADLCFATAFAGQASFAANIRTLRTNASCAADVIVDDVFYLDEPFFSDGQGRAGGQRRFDQLGAAGKKGLLFFVGGQSAG